MSALRFKGHKAILFASCLAVLALSAPAARADTIDDAAQVIDKINFALKASPNEQLPFTGDQLRFYRDMIKSCQGSSGADDVIACIDAASNSQAGQQAGIPDWFPQMIDVYFDIEEPDYWGLVQDAGEAAACAVAQMFSGGVDICGAIKELIKAAEEVAAAAEAVAKFLAEIGGAIADLADDFYCSIWDCDDGPTPLKDNDKAYAYFYVPRIPAGLAVRMTDAGHWIAYSGEGQGPNYTPDVVKEGLSVPGGGFTMTGLMQALSRFISDVNTQWDAKMVTAGGAVQKAANGWNSTLAKQYSDQIQASVNGFDKKLFFYKWVNGVSEGKLTAHNACTAMLNGFGGGKVDDWIAAGGPQRIKAAPGFPWSGDYRKLCDPFDALLTDQLRNFVVNGYSQRIYANCVIDDGNTRYYTCQSEYDVQNCWKLMDLTEGDRRQCKWTGPGKGVFKCKNGYESLPLPTPAKGYPGCTRQGIQGAPPVTAPDNAQ